MVTSQHHDGYTPAIITILIMITIIMMAYDHHDGHNEW